MTVEYADAGVRPRHLSDYLLSRGRPVVDLRSAADLMGLDLHAAADAMVRLRKAGLMFSPARGLYVAVPPEYRLWLAVPAMDFIDPMMAANSRQYYVALLSAAELHGAAHQRPQVFQVMVDKILADRDFGRVRIRFYSREHLPEVPVVSVNSSSGTVRVSSPAATLLDLTSRPGYAGGLSNVATVIAELVAETGLSAAAVLEAASAFPQSSLRRLGWIMDLVDSPLDRDLIASRLAEHSTERAHALLDARGQRRGRSDKRWGLVVNAEVEPDL